MRRLRQAAAARLRAAGVASPEFDADELLAHVLGTARGRLILADPPTPAQERAYDDLISRRAGREPLQHLTGVAHFRHVTLAVGPGVFVPRPETEALVGWVVEALASVERPRIVDLCTGSGAIPLALHDEIPGAILHAVELDPPAVAYAQRNLAGTGVDLRAGDFATAFDDLLGRSDVVTCNPPYVPLEAWESVTPEARDHDPHLALFSGDDGLDAFRILEARAARLLRPGGLLAAEHAEVQSEAVVSLFATSGRWTDVRDRRDLAGRPRFVTARLAR